MIITLTNIETAIISEVYYNQENKKLVIEYLKQNKYEYNDVPESVFFEIMNAESKGKYINSIKNDYDYEKIGTTETKEI